MYNIINGYYTVTYVAIKYSTRAQKNQNNLIRYNSAADTELWSSVNVIELYLIFLIFIGCLGREQNYNRLVHLIR